MAPDDARPAEEAHPSTPRSLASLTIVLTVFHLGLAVIFSIPAVQKAAKSWTWAWSPVENWNPALVTLPLLAALLAATIALRAGRWPLGIVNVVAAVGWGVLLFLQLSSSYVF